MKRIFATALLLPLYMLLPAQPFTKAYLMSFHVCDSNCTGFQDHVTHLAESNDGLNWTPVPNFPAYTASVPDIITRGSKAYIFSPGLVRRYDNGTGQWEANPVPLGIMDQNNTPVAFVDPSAIIDSAGNIVLFFLDATGIIGDPAGCSSYPCTKYIRSATEISGSDGTQFLLNSGSRLAVTLNQSPQTASDPDIFFDGSQYVLYVSSGPSTLAASCSTLHGSYTLFPSLPSGFLVQNYGGIPCGHYDSNSGQYWTFVHSNVNSSIEIRRAVHSNFNAQLSSFTTVLSGPIIGEPSSSTTESPGFCVNTLVTGIAAAAQPKLLPAYPNPAAEQVIVSFNCRIEKGILDLYDQKGSLLRHIPVSGNEFILQRDGLAAGLYFAKLSTDKNVSTVKIAFR